MGMEPWCARRQLSSIFMCIMYHMIIYIYIWYYIMYRVDVTAVCPACSAQSSPYLALTRIWKCFFAGARPQRQRATKLRSRLRSARKHKWTMNMLEAWCVSLRLATPIFWHVIYPSMWALHQVKNLWFDNMCTSPKTLNHTRSKPLQLMPQSFQAPTPFNADAPGKTGSSNDKPKETVPEKVDKKEKKEKKPPKAKTPEQEAKLVSWCSWCSVWWT